MIFQTFKSRSSLLLASGGSISNITVLQFCLDTVNASALSLVFSKRVGKSFHVRTHEIEV